MDLELVKKTGSNELNRKEKWQYVKKQLYRGRQVYLIFLPIALYFIIFHYLPMYGIIISFKDFKPLKGIFGSPWVGFKHFTNFFNSYYFWRILWNTIILNIYHIIFNFPAPIILALLLNEIRNNIFKRTVQTITYVPHFISMVVLVGIVFDLFSMSGMVNNIIKSFGGEPVKFLTDPRYFRPLYITIGVWQNLGWGTIVYLASLSSIDQELYEAATVDGAGRLKQAIHITLPGIIPTIITLFILQIGRIMNVGFEKVLLMQNPLNTETSEVISTFVYKRGLINAEYSYSTAIGLFNSVINVIILVTCNKISKRISETSLW